MNQINQQELQNLRELIGNHETMSNKMKDYANQCNDPQLRNMLQQSAQSANNTMEQLLSYLQ